MEYWRETGRNYAAAIPTIARCLARAKGGYSGALELAEAAQASDAVTRILKSAIGTGGLSDPEWAGHLADMPAVTTAFLQSLGGRSAFAALLEQGVITRAPLRSKVVANTSGVVASIVNEGAATPLRKMALNGATLTPQNAQAMVAFSRETIENTSTSSQAFIDRQLRKAVARVLDAGFYAALVGDESPSAVPIYTASGSDAAAMRVDLKKLLDDVNTGEGRLAWIAAKDTANSIALLDDPRGTVSPQGVSEFMGLPFAVSTGLAAGTLMLIDGDQICADVESFGIEIAREATIQMDDAPTQNSATPSAVPQVSLWQTDAAAIRLTARFGAQRGTNQAVAVLTDINWD